MNDIMKTVQDLQDSNILLKGVTEAIKNETKQQKGGFLGMLLGTLGASLLGNLLTGKGIVRSGEGTIRADEEIKKKALIPGNSSSRPLTNFEIEGNEPRFNGVYSRNNSPKTIKNGAYVINLDEYADVGAHWIALYVKNNEVIYFDSLGVGHVPKEIKRLIRHKNMKANTFIIQADNSIMWGYFCIGFIDFMLARKSLIDFTSLFSPYDLKKNDKIILDYVE